ncbi:hypothetical protein GW17_00047916 [Ensete ventricosum]|nr:hypothetical protein GW17_00047916 [Ensete ventricosum]
MAGHCQPPCRAGQTGCKDQPTAAKDPCKGATARKASIPQGATTRRGNNPQAGGRLNSAYPRPAHRGAVPIVGAACGHGMGHKGDCRRARVATAYAGAETATVAAKGGKRASASF